MSDKLTTILNKQAEEHTARDSYVDDARRNGGIDAATLASLDARVQAADRAAYEAKREQSEKLAAMSPAEWEAEKKRFIDHQEYEAFLRRQRL